MKVRGTRNESERDGEGEGRRRQEGRQEGQRRRDGQSGREGKGKGKGKGMWIADGTREGMAGDATRLGKKRFEHQNSTMGMSPRPRHSHATLFQLSVFFTRTCSPSIATPPSLQM